jgi:hypothetical protein
VRKKILKLSIPNLPNFSKIDSYLDHSNPLLEKWEIHINNSDIKSADAWCIIENVNLADRYCEINPENIFFLSAETAQNFGHIEESGSLKRYLDQFGKVFTFHQYLDDRCVSQPPFLPWMINANHGDSLWNGHERDVNYLDKLDFVQKRGLISVICSSQDMSPTHKMRLRFVKRLTEHFGDDLVWFGNGINSVEEKWDAIAPFKYTIVLENQSRHNVITEKLGDAFLGLSYPFYWGAANVDTIFNANGFTQINIEDFEGTIRKIREGIKDDLVITKHKYLMENKNIVLHEYNFVNRMLAISERLATEGNYQSITMKSLEMYVSSSRRQYNYLLSKSKKILNRIDNVLGTNFEQILREFYVLMRYNKVTNFLKIRLEK